MSAEANAASSKDKITHFSSEIRHDNASKISKVWYNGRRKIVVICSVFMYERTWNSSPPERTGRGAGLKRDEEKSPGTNN
jgi:hypothetical protein